MRLLLFISFISIISLNAKSQIAFRHILSQKNLDSNGFKILLGNQETTLNGNVKGIITVSGGSIKFDIFQFSKSTSGPGISKSTDIPPGGATLTDNRKKYGDATRVLKVRFRAVTYGLNTIPFRFRPSVTVNNTEIPASGTTGFQLAIYTGYTVGFSQITSRAINNWSITTAVFAGPSTADLKKETVKSPSTWTTNQTNATITYGGNLIFARNNVGIVLAYGWENALGKNRKEWIYNGKPFFGIGVNTSFMR